MKLESLLAAGVLRADASGGSTHQDLAEALADVRAAVSAGQSAASVFGGGRQDLLPDVSVAGARLAGFATPLDVAAGSEVLPEALVSVRTAPLAGADPLVADWARAMRPSASRGPFINALGERFWIDTFALPPLVTIMAQGRPFSPPVLVARIPVSRAVLARPILQLGAGSVWLPARVLVRGRPANEFVGMRILGGRVVLAGVTGAGAGTITLGGAWSLMLDVELDPPANPSPAAGPGADSANAAVSLPATATITITANGLASLGLGDAAMTVYDSSVGFARGGDPPFYDELTRSIVVPCPASTEAFAFRAVRSAAWRIDGSPRVTRSGWALLVAVTTPQALGEASGAGYQWLELGGGSTIRWTGLPAPATPPKVVLGAAPGAITIWATANPADVTHRLRLWNEQRPDPLRQSSVEVISQAGSTVMHVNQPGVEAVIFAGRATGHFDRPVAADGGRLAVHLPAAWFVLLELPAGTTAGVVGIDVNASAAPHLALALENALLKVRPPGWLGVSGPLTGNQLESGLLVLRFARRWLIPTLPDPYAANFDPPRQQDVDNGWITAAVSWPDPATALLRFAADGGPPVAAPFASAFAATRGARYQARPVLLDVSSNADQFGVTFPIERADRINVAGMALVAPASDVAVLTLPPISWEPMLTKTPEPGSGDIPLPPPPHDGGAAILTADAADIRPVEPIPLVQAYHDAINQRRHFMARFPLPFGLIANVNTRAATAGPTSTFPDGNAVFLNRPGFVAGLLGGLQFALRGKPVAVPGGIDPTWPGSVEFVSTNDYALGVLSQNIFTRFEGDFGAGAPSPAVPLRCYELSGYGASLLSDWHDFKSAGPAIIEVRFDVLVGRTAHEVIQMQSVLHPWHIRVVRTITMDRTRGGWILREDSGWVPASDGRFEYPGAPPTIPPAFDSAHKHPGAIDGLINVRNIRLAGAQFPVSRQGSADPPTVWQAVTFDADVLFTGSANPRLGVRGGAAGGRVPARGITGWIQIGGPTYDANAGLGPPVIRVRPASGQQVFDLLLLKGPAMAPIGCGLELGGVVAEPGLVLRASRIDVSCNDDSTVPHLVVAVRGSPVLPRDGAWSLARRATGDPAPNALDPAFAVPMVRPNGFQQGATRWHLADPTDITRLGDTAAPQHEYSLVQSLGTQKVLFSRPRAGNDPQPITLPQPPRLADMGALLNAAGVFPGLAQAFDFIQTKALSVTGGDLGFSEVFPIGPGKEAVLIDLGGADAIQVVIEYHDELNNSTQASIHVDPMAVPRWELSLARACFSVRFHGNPLISIFATVRADERTAPTVVDLNVRYEGILQALQSIFTNIQQVAKFLPGGVGANLRIGFSQGHLTVRNAFALPNLPLGAGQITDIAVDMGFDVALSPVDVRFVAGLGSSQKPFRWIVSPLAGTGVVQVAIGTGGLDVLVQCGLGLGLAIDLGIASGSASVALALELNTGPDPFELRAILSGRASVDVLAGLASATITLAAGLGIIPPPQLFKPPYLPPSLPPPDPIGPFDIGLTASVSAGIHISICWVIDVDWEGYWQFRQDIHVPAIDIPLV